MSKLSPISQKELISKLKKFGFNGPYPGGKHLFMINGKLRLTIPNTHKQIIGLDLLSRILKQANISKDKWINN
jgi:predicted RNA binding protein YcfA (HicA-like mRNA interferase family)